MRRRVFWDIHTDKVTRRSSRWAASDRGWLFATDSKTSLGYYLDYGYIDHHRERPEGAVLAVVCGEAANRRVWCKTVADAQAWIEAETKTTGERLSPRALVRLRQREHRAPARQVSP
jgi:hypothetical protein